MLEEVVTANTKERIGKTVRRAGQRLPAAQERRAVFLENADAIHKAVAHATAQQHARLGGFKFLPRRVGKVPPGVGVREYDEAGVRAKLSGAHRAGGEEFVGQCLAALAQ